MEPDRKLIEMQIENALRQLEEDVLGALRSENTQLHNGAMRIVQKALLQIERSEDAE